MKNPFLVTKIMVISTSLSTLVVYPVAAQITPPFVPTANQSSSSTSNGNSTQGQTPSPTQPADPLNTNGILGNINQQIDGISNTVDQTQAGLQKQVQENILNQPTVKQAQNIFNGISGIGDQIANIGDRIGDLIARFNLNALLALFNINSSTPSVAVSGGLAGGGKGSNNTSAVTMPPGVLQLPDIAQAKSTIQSSKTAAIEEFFGSKTGGQGSFVIKRNLEFLLHSQTAREVGEATALSANGQKVLKANAEAANQALTTSAKLAENSKNQDVSQNILRNISGQMQAQQQTQTLVAVDAQLRARDDSLRNVLLSDTLDEAMGINIAQRRMESSAYSAAITQGAQFMLPGYSGQKNGGPKS